MGNGALNPGPGSEGTTSRSKVALRILEVGKRLDTAPRLHGSQASSVCEMTRHKMRKGGCALRCTIDNSDGVANHVLALYGSNFITDEPGEI